MFCVCERLFETIRSNFFNNYRIYYLVKMSSLRGLLVIGLVLTASGFLSESVGNVFGPLEYKGYVVFDYPEGDNPITNIVFTIDSTLAGNLLIVDVPSPWSYQYGNGELTLTGGSLNAGGTVQVRRQLGQACSGCQANGTSPDFAAAGGPGPGSIEKPAGVSPGTCYAGQRRYKYRTGGTPVPYPGGMGRFACFGESEGICITD